MKVSFWTPISYISEHQSFSTRVVSLVDSYFDCWGGTLCSPGKAYVVPAHMNLGERQVVPLWKDDRSSPIVALKMASHLIVIIPTVMFIFKTFLRSIYHFEIADLSIFKEGLRLSQEQKNKLDHNIRELVRGRNPSDCVIHTHKANVFGDRSWVFSIRSIKGLIFTLEIPNDDQGDLGEKAQAVILAHGLKRIMLPNFKKISTEVTKEQGYGLYVQEELDLQEVNNEVELDQATVRELYQFCENAGPRFKLNEWRQVRGSNKVTVPLPLLSEYQ